MRGMLKRLATVVRGKSRKTGGVRTGGIKPPRRDPTKTKKIPTRKTPIKAMIKKAPVSKAGRRKSPVKGILGRTRGIVRKATAGSRRSSVASQGSYGIKRRRGR